MRAKPIVANFISAGRKARCAPDPAYPSGIRVDAAGDKPGCEVQLTYPAPCVGQWMIRCSICDASVIVTAAGRPDDPHTVKIPCNLKGSA